MAKNASSPQRIVIIGGGYGGIRTALTLGRRRISGLSITLISGKANFEYYPTLYRVVTGRSPEQVAVPLKEIFSGLNVTVAEDVITEVNLEGKIVSGKEQYPYEYLVLAPGAETGYFNIPGLPEYSYGMKSVPEALKLKKHLHSVLTPSEDPAILPERKVQAAHIVVVGGGPTGVELSCEMMKYARSIAVKQKFEPSLITVDLVEASPRLLPTMPADISQIVLEQVRACGVNVFVNRTVIKQESEELFLKESQVRTDTVIWTAGVKTNRLIGQIVGLELDKRGRVVVDDSLQAKGHQGVFVIGDAASTLYAGLAQTANIDGSFVAKCLMQAVSGRSLPKYVPHRPIYAVPAGHKWAVVLWGETRIYGWLGYVLRELADLRYFLQILPVSRAIHVFSKHDVYVD